jgi:hypothetical protein
MHADRAEETNDPFDQAIVSSSNCFDILKWTPLSIERSVQRCKVVEIP